MVGVALCESLRHAVDKLLQIAVLLAGLLLNMRVEKKGHMMYGVAALASLADRLLDLGDHSDVGSLAQLGLGHPDTEHKLAPPLS